MKAVIHEEYLPPGVTVAADCYTDTLMRLLMAIIWKQPSLLSQNVYVNLKWSYFWGIELWPDPNTR